MQEAILFSCDNKTINQIDAYNCVISVFLRKITYSHFLIKGLVQVKWNKCKKA